MLKGHTADKGGEWDYLLTARKNSGDTDGSNTARYANATVHSVPDLILIPDGCQKNSDNTATVGGFVLKNVNVSGKGAAFDGNDISTGWENKLKKVGCIFLPCSGYWYGTSVSNVRNYGLYWSSVVNTISDAYCLGFYSNSVTPTGVSERYYGGSVRLVCPR